jgi:hypothetical protein
MLLPARPRLLDPADLPIRLLMQKPSRMVTDLIMETVMVMAMDETRVDPLVEKVY